MSAARPEGLEGAGRAMGQGPAGLPLSHSLPRSIQVPRVGGERLLGLGPLAVMWPVASPCPGYSQPLPGERCRPREPAPGGLELMLQLLLWPHPRGPMASESPRSSPGSRTPCPLPPPLTWALPGVGRFTADHREP